MPKSRFWRDSTFFTFLYFPALLWTCIIMGIFTHIQDTATLVRMMKISYYPVIFCLSTLISHKKKTLDDGWGATYPSWFILPPTQIFDQWLAMHFVIAVRRFNNYKQIYFIKYRYCLLVYKTHFLKFIHLLVGGGGQHILAGLPYPPPKILEWWLFTDNEMTLKYYST